MTSSVAGGTPPARSRDAGFCILPVLFVVLVVIAIALYYVYLLGGTDGTGGHGAPGADVQGRAVAVSAAVPAPVPGPGTAATTPAPAIAALPRASVQQTATAARDIDAERGYAALESGDYERAAALLASALDRAGAGGGATGDLSTALASALNALGVGLYNEGRHAEALARLTEAASVLERAGLGAGPVLVNRAVVEMAMRDFAAAEATLERAGDTPRANELKVQLLRLRASERMATGDARGAAALLERAAAIDPSGGSAAAELDAARKRAAEDEGMTQSRTGRFVVRYEGAENAVAGHLIGILLEEAYLKVGTDLGYYPDRPVEALLYTGERFADVTHSPSWAGAIYDGRIKIPSGGLAGRTAALEQVVFHEYTHALVHMLSAGRAPTWLNEGLAEYEEGRSGARGRSDAALRDFVAKGGELRLSAFEGSFMGLSAAEAQLAYMVSLSAASYLIDEYGAGAAVRVLRRQAAGDGVDAAFRSVIYIGYDDFEGDWLRALAR